MIRLLLACLLTTSIAVAQWTPTVLWDQSGPGDSSGFGYRILPLGDQNNDGFADFGVLSWGVLGTVPGRLNAGKLELFHGGNPLTTQPYRRFLGDSASLQQVEDAYPAGDVNGDGYTDWTVQLYRQAELPYEKVHLFLGGPDVDTTAVAVWTIRGPEEFLSVGDFNGDGFDDLIWSYYGTWFNQIFFGSTDMDTLPDWQASGWVPFGAGDLTGDGFSDFAQGNTIFVGAAMPDTVPAYVWMGLPGAGVGIVNDLNGDGTAELLISAYPQVNMHWGRDSLRREADASLTFPCAGSSFHHAYGLGDINHDGYGDCAILNAESCTNAYAGVLAVYLGHPWLNPNPATVFVGRTPPFNLNAIWTTAGLGDVNGDGIDDWAIGGYGTLAGFSRRGRVVIIAGDTDLVAAADEPHPVVPMSLEVSVYPNPFNSTTEIRYAVPHASHVSLKVFDVTGREVCVLVDGVVNVGEQRVAWDANGVASGVYFVRLDAGEMRVTRKVLLVR